MTYEQLAGNSVKYAVCGYYHTIVLKTNGDVYSFGRNDKGQLGIKTLLIDGDLRRPVIHSIFGVPKDEGLTQYLLSNLSYDKLIKEIVIDGLSVITCGLLPPNPSELLSSKSMDALLVKVRKEFDLVLIDTPPVIAVTDAAVLSTKVDGTIVVVKANETRKANASDRRHNAKGQRICFPNLRVQPTAKSTPKLQIQQSKMPKM